MLDIRRTGLPLHMSVQTYNRDLNALIVRKCGRPCGQKRDLPQRPPCILQFNIEKLKMFKKNYNNVDFGCFPTGSSPSKLFLVKNKNTYFTLSDPHPDKLL